MRAVRALSDSVGCAGSAWQGGLDRLNGLSEALWQGASDRSVDRTSGQAVSEGILAERLGRAGRRRA